MSSDRNTSRPLKPSLASTRTARTPLTPRVAASNVSSTTTTPVTRPAAPRLPTNRTLAVSPRVRAQDEVLGRDAATTLTVTPRPGVRKSRVESTQSSPSQDDPPSDSKPKSSLGPADMSGRSSVVSGLSLASNNNALGKPKDIRQKSVVGGGASRSPPLVRSPGLANLGSSGQTDSIDSRFFHASDAPRQEPAPKRPEPKKSPSFFYADAQHDRPPITPTISPPKAPSPVLSAVSEQRSTGPWIRPEGNHNPSRSPPALSPSFTTATGSSPYFTANPSAQGPYRSPSPSKENIHLSYRKGASQIFGMRPTPSPATSPALPEEPRRPSFGPRHKKSTSLSSIDSGTSQQSRRRSATGVDATTPAASPLAQEIKSRPVSHISTPPVGLPSIDTSLASPINSSSQPILSPNKNAAELAADARRERKVLDLEISNSSLLAINSSLERELRRQKAELKRFRRLSRAGRFSVAPHELPGRPSDGLSTLSEEDAESNDPFDQASGLGDDDNLSESEEDDSLMSGSEPLSPGAQSNRQQDRLAKDERRLRVDLERHKELLSQSQAMNQSIKRCMYATEEMIRDGKKALEYHVRVSDVKLGGRILTGHEDDEIEVEDEEDNDDGMQNARELLDTWSGLGRRLGGSEVSRDSGIEVDKPLLNVSARLSNISNPVGDSGRPPEDHTNGGAALLPNGS